MVLAETFEPGTPPTLSRFASPACWDGEPPRLATPLEDARRYCEWLATQHYENFPVVTRLLPPRLRPHFHALYAYCRWADDLADEVHDPWWAMHLLDAWERELIACYDGKPRHPVMVALRETILECDIPAQPFHDLITAFRRDQTIHRYETLEDLFDYCRYSANPVGRLVLYACGYRSPELQQLSDKTCTALQLANFWQDVRRDYGIGRIYIPRASMARHGVTELEICTLECTIGFRNLMRDLIANTRELFEQGLPLANLVDRHLGIDIELFSRGGMEILRLIERQNYDTLSRRPQLAGSEMALLVASVLLRRMSCRKSTAAVRE
jgi:squalene synthase HpnC